MSTRLTRAERALIAAALRWLDSGRMVENEVALLNACLELYEARRAPRRRPTRKTVKR